MLVCTAFVGMSTNVCAGGSPPVAEANGPYTAPECYSVLLDASHSYDPDNDVLTYRWFIDGSWINNYGNPLLEYLWQDDFSGEVTLEVSDGTFTATDTASVTIYNTPPQILSTDGPLEVNLGEPVNMAVNFFDGLYDPQRGLVIPSFDTFNATFYWGDFGSDVLSLGVEDFWANASHLYSEPGIYHIIVTVVDDNGGMASTDWYVKVGENLPDFEAGPDRTINEGDMFLSYGYFLGIEPVEVYSAMVDYGDGSGAQPLTLSSGYTFDLSHQYIENGEYTVDVTFYWNSEFYGSDTALVTVLNVAPTALFINDGPKNEGSAVTVSFIDQYDPGILDSFTYSFDWDHDGVYDIVDQADSSAMFTWNNAGNYVVGGEIQDDDDGFTKYTTTVTVSNYILLASFINDGPKDEGSLVTVSFTDQYDSGGFATFAYSFDWNDDGIYEIVDQADASATHTWYDDGAFTVRGMIKNEEGRFTEYLTTVIVNNVAPTAVLSNDGPKDEGSPVTITFADQFDPGTSDIFTYSFDLNNDGVYEIVDSSNCIATYTWYENGLYPVNGMIKDDDGGFTEYTTIVTVDNVPPTIISLTGPPTDPIELGTPIVLHGVFVDPGILDSHVARIIWGDGQKTTVNLVAGVYEVSGSHTYASAGVYTIALNITDDDGGYDNKSLESYVVIYNVNCGFVTGGGWIIAPQGSYPSDPTLSGRCNFGFVSKYKKGRTVPEGNTEFQFQVGGINFHSHTYEWLIITGPIAMYKGSGTVNGAGSYEFVVTVLDGKIAGGGIHDQFRIRIWDSTNDVVLFDSLMTDLSGGQITIHK